MAGSSAAWWWGARPAAGWRAGTIRRCCSAVALAVTAAGSAVLWPSTAPAQALVGLSLLGIGLGNAFPLGISVTVALAPGRAAPASGRAVATTSFAVLLAPLTVGALADATSLLAALGVVPVVLALGAAVPAG